MSDVQPRHRLKVLHIRPRGWMVFGSVRESDNYRNDEEYMEALPAVRDFASWAFGPSGLPDLEVLAYGDFSFQGRQPNILLCRSGDDSVPGFRELKKEDRRLWELVQKNTDFLEACPEDYLLHQW